MSSLKPYRRSALRVVLDTQVILRGAVAKGASITAKIYDVWRQNRFVLLTSEAIVKEISEVLHRPKLQSKLKITPFKAKAIVAIIQRDAEFIEVVTSIRKCRDPKDDKFLACSVDGKADYLVSADKDILTLKSIQQTPIIDIPTFWQKLSDV
ncbi:MAG: putative toxin-antitoxin system toxin component, PIN family [Candidatus Poribacteria bacterium]